MNNKVIAELKTVPMSFRVAPEFRQRVASNVRKGRPGEVLYFSTASDLLHAAIADYLDRIEASSTN